MSLKPDKTQTAAWVLRRRTLLDRIEARYQALDDSLRDVELQIERDFPQPLLSSSQTPQPPSAIDASPDGAPPSQGKSTQAEGKSDSTRGSRLRKPR